MSLRLRTVCFAGVFVGCGVLLAVGCSDSSSKKLVHGNQAGEGGAAGEAAGGTSSGSGGMVITPEGGAGGEVSAAGEGGAPAVGAAGEGGAVAEGGAAGAGPACVPTGVGTGVTLGTPNVQKVCRGAIVTASFTATTADDLFACCGLSDGVAPYAVDIGGTTIGREGDAYGNLAITVPAFAPFGVSHITATCSGGPVTNTFDVDVQEGTALPSVDGFQTNPISSGDTLTINGSNLGLVTTITAVSVDGSNLNADCAIDTQQQFDDAVNCSFGGNIAPGDYNIVVEQTDCGAVVSTEVLTIILAT